MIDKIYSNFDKFVDAAVEDKSRSQIAVELADLAASLGIDKDRFLSTIFSDDITQWLKFHTRHGRQLSTFAVVASPRVICFSHDAFHEL